MTFLCVPILVESEKQTRRDLALAEEAGAEMVELRIDPLCAGDNAFDERPIAAIARASKLPCIITCRSVSEGGESALTGGQTVGMLHNFVQLGITQLDIELGLLRDFPELVSATPDARWIVSVHHFTERPFKLYNILDEMNALPGQINKIAWMARSIRDNIEAFEILQHRQKPTIALCMGEAGLISRVLAKKLGAFLTFASLRDERATAPGQVTIHDMKNLYRWDAIKPSTKVFGVVGSPVAHSLSPAIHNAAFDATGFDGVYLPMLVNPGYESFKAFMESLLAFQPLDLAGLSITIPHKENALRYLQEKGASIDELAVRVGAVNTIKIDGSTLVGTDTDFDAILDSITSKLDCTRDALADKRVAVIGAGGTGRTAVAALASCGATVVVYNRTRDRADQLAEEFNGRDGRVVSARLEKLCDSCCHIFINTTPVGMHPDVDASPLGDRLPSFTPDTLVFDTIYNPIQTKLLKQAQASGATTLSGIEMFLRQGATQFEHWTGLPAPMAAMRRAMEKRL